MSKIKQIVILGILMILTVIMLLIIIVQTTAAAPIMPNDPLPPGEQIPDVDDPCWEVTWRSEDGTVQQLTYICQHEYWQTGYWTGCIVIVETRCKNQPELDPPPIGRICTQIGSRTFDCGPDVQQVKWERNVKKICSHYVPLTSLNVYTESESVVCSCVLYSINGYRNIINAGNEEFYLSLPAFPQMGYAPDLQVYTGDTIYHQGVWGGEGGWGADPCFVSSELKVKAKDHPPTYLDCTPGVCSYDCYTMHLTQTATLVRHFVYLEDEHGNKLECRGEYNAFDPCNPLTHTCLDTPLPYDGE